MAQSPIEFVNELVLKAIKEMNGGISRKLTARGENEKPPADTRHLTDTRTRVSTLLEYGLAYEMNHVLVSEKSNYTVSAVLWNIFPDLVVRDAKHNYWAGIEVKALHTAAEEKSANLDAPLHIINKSRDFVVILIWVWRRGETNGVAIVYPEIIKAEVIDAYDLAMIRDYAWLHNNKGRTKLIDIGTPMIAPEDGDDGRTYKAEEGNMGKLMRIGLPDSMPKATVIPEHLQAASKQYVAFQEEVLCLGVSETYREMCGYLSATDVKCDEVKKYPTEVIVLGSSVLPDGSEFMLAAGRLQSTRLRTAVGKAKFCVWFGSKLEWRLIASDGKGSFKEIGDGKKAESSYAEIMNLVGQK